MSKVGLAKLKRNRLDINSKIEKERVLCFSSQ